MYRFGDIFLEPNNSYLYHWEYKLGDRNRLINRTLLLQEHCGNENSVDDST